MKDWGGEPDQSRHGKASMQENFTFHQQSHSDTAAVEPVDPLQLAQPDAVLQIIE